MAISPPTFSLVRTLQEVEPDEVYNLGAQSHVAVSFGETGIHSQFRCVGSLRLLEAIRILSLVEKTGFYRALRLRSYTGWFVKCPSPRNPILSAQPLCSCQVVRLLDYSELSRGLRCFCL
ncbi:MAG: hypothetical protein CM1200mP41_29140 [Gammaproteobacteria bacterium]|nr:MAG: hypothetical protein CM1200mP41_29140 [Gammaproteobacteria bacterium]